MYQQGNTTDAAIKKNCSEPEILFSAKAAVTTPRTINATSFMLLKTGSLFAFMLLFVVL